MRPNLTNVKLSWLCRKENMLFHSKGMPRYSPTWDAMMESLLPVPSRMIGSLSIDVGFGNKDGMGPLITLLPISCKVLGL